MLVVRRDRTIEPIRFGYAPRAGDVVSMAVYKPDEENVNAWLQGRGWTRIPEQGASPDTGPA